MRMQEPEQRQQSAQEWQSGQEGYGAYRADSSYDSSSSADWQQSEHQQKIYPQASRKQQKVIGIFLIVLSSICFFLTLAGLITSAILLENSDVLPGALIAAPIIGLVSSILAMLISITMYVLSMVSVFGHSKKRWKDHSGFTASD